MKAMKRAFAMMNAVALRLAAINCIATAQTNTAAPARETLSLDQGWRFHPADVPLTAFGDSGGLAFADDK